MIGVGKGTKLLQSYLSGSKRYTAVARFGSATDTYDNTGTVIETKAYDFITDAMIERALPAFTGIADNNLRS